MSLLLLSSASCVVLDPCKGKFGYNLFSIQVFLKEKAAKAILVQKQPKFPKEEKENFVTKCNNELWLQKVNLCFF
jgi:hypothetical protein